MPKAKPKWGFNFTPSPDLYWEPNEQEVIALMDELSGFLKVNLEKTDNQKIKHRENELITFKDFLFKLITEYRESILYDQYYPSKASVKETLLYLKNIATELEKRFEPLSLHDGIDEDTWHLLEGCLPNDHEGLGKFYEDGVVLRNSINKALSQLDKKVQKTGRKSHFRQKVWLAKNVIITFNQILKLRPSKTRGGKLDTVVGKILKACHFEQGDFTVNGYEAEQNFRIIKTALDEIKEESHFLDPWLVNKKRVLKYKELPTPQYAIIKGDVYIEGKQVKK